MDQVGVYWINLKPHLLPCVVQEVETVAKRHRSKPKFRKQIHKWSFFQSRQELLLSARNGNSDARRNLEFLNVSIKARIEDFDNFYANHFQDFRMPFFEKQKYRLRRLLVESLAANPNFIEGEELQILTDQELEDQRVGTMDQVTGMKDLGSTFGTTAGRNHPMLFSSPMRRTQGNSSKMGGASREKKRELIEKSVQRLTSPHKTTKFAAEYYNEDDLVFSIKMSKEEYDEYLRTKENYDKKLKKRRQLSQFLTLL